MRALRALVEPLFVVAGACASSARAGTRRSWPTSGWPSTPSATACPAGAPRSWRGCRSRRCSSRSWHDDAPALSGWRRPHRLGATIDNSFPKPFSILNGMTATIDRTTTAPKRVLMVVANPTTSTTTGWPVGFWASELFHPLYEFTEAGYDVTVASPDGGPVEVDGMSDPR